MASKRERDIAAGKRMLRVYGITLKEYIKMLSKQGGVCYICQRPAKTVRLAIDHKHFKIAVVRIVTGWKAYVVGHESLRAHDTVQKKAIKKLREKTKKLSVRGCLCTWCNTGLKKYRDDPVRLRRAAAYLERYQKKLESVLNANQ